MKTMTGAQRLQAALQGEQPDRVPCWPVMFRWIRQNVGCPCPQHQLEIAREFGFDPLITYGHYICDPVRNDYVYSPGGSFSYSALGSYGDLPNVDTDIRIENREEQVWYHRTFRTPAGELHDVIQWPRPNTGYGDGPNPHRMEPLVKRPEDLDALRYLYPPEPRKDVIADIGVTLKAVSGHGLLMAADASHAGGWGMEPLGPEQMLTASIEQPELLHGVCQLAQKVHLRNLEIMLHAGIRVVFDSWFQCGPSVGWSPASYREFFLPLVKQAVELAHHYKAIYIYQDDGKMKGILPMAIEEAGVDAVSGLQPPPLGDVVLAEVKARWGKRVAIVGGLDPCYTFDLGSVEAVRQASRQAIEEAGKGGGYILGTAEAIAPETPRELLRAAAQACLEFGQY